MANMLSYLIRKKNESFLEMDKVLGMMIKKGWKGIDVIFLRGENTIVAHALMERI